MSESSNNPFNPGEIDGDEDFESIEVVNFLRQFPAEALSIVFPDHLTASKHLTSRQFSQMALTQKKKPSDEELKAWTHVLSCRACFQKLAELRAFLHPSADVEFDSPLPPFDEVISSISTPPTPDLVYDSPHKTEPVTSFLSYASPFKIVIRASPNLGISFPNLLPYQIAQIMPGGSYQTIYRSGAQDKTPEAFHFILPLSEINGELDAYISLKNETLTLTIIPIFNTKLPGDRVGEFKVWRMVNGERDDPLPYPAINREECKMELQSTNAISYHIDNHEYDIESEYLL